MNKVFLHDFAGLDPVTLITAAFLGIKIPPQDMEDFASQRGLTDVEWDLAVSGTLDEYSTYRNYVLANIADKAKEFLPAGAELLFAVYKNISHDGHAFVLYKHENTLYEVNGHHCSCMGLEGQWEPEDTTIEAIEHRLIKGTLGRERSHNSDDWCIDEDDWEELRESENIFAEELLAFIQEYRKFTEGA